MFRFETLSYEAQQYLKQQKNKSKTARDIIEQYVRNINSTNTYEEYKNEVDGIKRSIDELSKKIDSLTIHESIRVNDEIVLEEHSDEESVDKKNLSEEEIAATNALLNGAVF